MRLDEITQGEHVKKKSVPRASVIDLYLTKYVLFTMCHLLLTYLILLTTGETDLLFHRGESTQERLSNLPSFTAG